MSSKTKRKAQEDDGSAQAKQGTPSKLVWLGPAQAPLQLCGFAWYTVDRVFRRLPLRPPKPFRKPVVDLAANTAGGQIRFRTDSNRVVVEAHLHGSAKFDHMAPTGQCGFDAYAGDPRRERPRFCRVTRFNASEPAYECELGGFLDRTLRTITINFPLYEGVRAVRIGLDADARVQPPPPFRTRQRVVVYGTSITQGGCASRPGMAYTNILSRWLNVEFINLGFSGNGQGDPEVAEVMSLIPRVGCLVLDYEGNVGLDGMKETLEPFIRILRTRHRRTPILVLSCIPFSCDLTPMTGKRDMEAMRKIQRETVTRLRRGGDRNVHFLSGANLLGPQADEGTVDGVHPTDLGFFRMAERLEPILRRLLFG
jgi:hypothetical protein